MHVTWLVTMLWYDLSTNIDNHHLPVIACHCVSACQSQDLWYPHFDVFPFPFLEQSIKHNYLVNSSYYTKFVFSGIIIIRCLSDSVTSWLCQLRTFRGYFTYDQVWWDKVYEACHGLYQHQAALLGEANQESGECQLWLSDPSHWYKERRRALRGK